MLVNERALFSWDYYHQAPIIGIVRGESIETCELIARAFLKAEMFTLEVTMNTERADLIIEKLSQNFPTLNIGAGTVCDMKSMEKALNAGAKFIVTPIVNEEVIKSCVEHNIPVFPGAFTPTEIYKAWSLGASAVKVFPISQLGVQYIKDILAPLNSIKLIPTGGVTPLNLESYFKAGVFGVGMGSALLDKVLIDSGDVNRLTAHFMKIRNLYRKSINTN
jgi:2-dehydro-3-deoxyphosphogluconate aldolase/(4S)-4-hydroxy-2-oxoglutarate aldolase